MSDPASATAQWYDRFARLEARGQSDVYEQWALGVAADPEVLALIDELPRLRRQPNLIFACARLCGAPEGPYPSFRAWLVKHWPLVRAEASHRLTQTNEARRCAVLLPALAAIDGPIALLEVGAAAGLCLYPDRYSYSYDGKLLHPAAGASAVMLESSTNGPVPTRLPNIVWRAGIDLAPLDAAHPDDRHWLETLIWPEQHARRDLLRAALDIAAADPPLLVAGDATDALLPLAARAPHDATLVIVSSGVLVYLVRAERDRFADAVSGLDATWVSLEAAGLFPAIADTVRAARGLSQTDLDGRFALSVNQVPLALVGPHGQFLDYL